MPSVAQGKRDREKRSESSLPDSNRARRQATLSSQTALPNPPACATFGWGHQDESRASWRGPEDLLTIRLLTRHANSDYLDAYDYSP